MPPTFLLRTKLLPPRPIPGLLPRPRLIERLQANLTHPITLITANAGSGKTTLVAEFVRQHAAQFVWYQLDHTDADLTVFPAYLVHGIRQRIADFGEVTLSYLRQEVDEIVRHPERIADVLLNEILEAVEEQLTLVLDDYHHLGTETTVHRVMDRLLAYAPDTLHFIIISREMPPLNLTRLRSQSALTVIDREEMLFTDEETQELFRRVFGLELTAEQLNEYRERTKGWITALQLVRQVAQRQTMTGHSEGQMLDLSAILRQSERDIFNYFAEEVFNGESEEAQALLLRIALLEQVEVGICRQLWPHLNCERHLPLLERRNIFITAASDENGEVYRLHPLFQDFLRRRLIAEIGRDRLSDEYLRLAEFFLARRLGQLGVRYLLKAEAYERAATIIAEQGPAWLSAGAFGAVASLIASLPSSVIEAHPRVMSVQGEIARMQGDYGAAQQLLQHAAKLLREKRDALGESEALHSLATIARRQRDMQSAFAYLDRAIALTNDQSPVRIRCGNTRGLCLLASGDLAAAEREFRIALQLAEEQGDEHHARLIAHNLGLPAMIRGDFGGALKWLRRMLRQQDAASLLPRDAIAYLNMARCYFYQERWKDSEHHLNRALDCCQRYNLTALTGEIFEAYGNLYRESGDVQRASEFYERAARAYEAAGIEITQHELLEEQAVLSMQLGDLVTARSQIDRLINARATSGNTPGVLTASLVRGRILLKQGDAAGAQEELKSARTYFRDQGLNYYEAQSCLLLAACAFELKQEVSSVECLQRAIELAIRFDYEGWLKREISLNPGLFALPQVIELLPEEMHELVVNPTQSQPRTPRIEGAIILPKPVTDLTINLLGPIEIYRDPQRQFATDAWTTRRARDILCFIATRPHCRASKDVITDTFWRDADFETTEKNFHPTISHIRKALNSNQLIKQKFLLYRDGDYFLNPELTYRIDTIEFDRLVEQGDAARRAGKVEEQVKAFEEAVVIYRGEFMQSVYDEWTNELRAYYREQYLRLLEALTGIAQKTEDWVRSIHLARKILRDDPYREDIHCLVMRAQARLGKVNAVREQYESLRQLLKDELGIEPAAETRKVYLELTNK